MGRLTRPGPLRRRALALAQKRLAAVRRKRRCLQTPAQVAGWIDVADFNRDSKPDLAFVDFMGNQLYVLLNDSH